MKRTIQSIDEFEQESKLAIILKLSAVAGSLMLFSYAVLRVTIEILG
ncbi:MAG TPA: hypothetical protein VIK74_08200 [Parasegetibacter sp.]